MVQSQYRLHEMKNKRTFWINDSRYLGIIAMTKNSTKIPVEINLNNVSIDFVIFLYVNRSFFTKKKTEYNIHSLNNLNGFTRRYWE